MFNYVTEYGSVSIGERALATIVGAAVNSAFGVAGMAYKNAADGIVGLLKFDNIEKGVRVTCQDNEISIDIHIVMTYGINIRAISESITHNVSYAVEKATGIKVKEINVFVDSIRA